MIYDDMWLIYNRFAIDSQMRKFPKYFIVFIMKITYYEDLHKFVINL